jgi:uncharacterized membrane protein YkoI
MLKRVLYGSGAIGVLTAGYLLGSVSLGGAFAQTAPTATPAQSQTAPATRAPAAKEQAESGQPEASEQAESAALAGQAKITEAQANTTALGQFAGGTVTKTELDSENGKVIYTVHLTDSAGKKQEAKVDATTGTLLPAEAAEGPETRGTPGAPETGETQD